MNFRRLARVALCALALGASAEAATTPNSFVTPQTPNRGYYAFVAATPVNTPETVYTAGANGARCFGAVGINNDTVSHNIYLELFSGSNQFYSDGVTIPANAGGPGIAPQPMMGPTITPGLPVDQYGNQYLQLAAGDKVAAGYNSVMSGSSVAVIYIMCSDY
jgi:hypothetical protein